jgi:hypothetical protein
MEGQKTHRVSLGGRGCAARLGAAGYPSAVRPHIRDSVVQYDFKMRFRTKVTNVETIMRT